MKYRDKFTYIYKTLYNFKARPHCQDRGIDNARMSCAKHQSYRNEDMMLLIITLLLLKYYTSYKLGMAFTLL